MVINLSVGSRNGESTELPGDVDSNDWFNRASASHDIGGKKRVDPTEGELRSMKEGDSSALAPGAAKCDQFGTCHGTEPIILPFHDDDMNAARWMRDLELRKPVHGAARRAAPLFSTEDGKPFKNATFARIVKEALKAVLGPTRAALLSTHSWRVWLASALRMCGASDARIQAFGRWLNPDSIKIYARMSKQEYALWIDKLMSVKRIDTARTTSLPVMDAADAIAAWGNQLHIQGSDELELWTAPQATPAEASPPPCKAGDRVSVYWTELKQWYEGTFTKSIVENADSGGRQRSSRIVYDQVGLWANCTTAQLTYWHCLDDDLWHLCGDGATE